MEQSDTPKSSPSRQNVLLIIIGSVLLLFVGFAGGFLYAKSNQKQIVEEVKQAEVTEPTQIPAISQAAANLEPVLKSEIPISENTVSYTYSGNTLYMRYKGFVYDETSAEQGDSSLTKIENPDQLTWYGLVNPPANLSDRDGFNELFMFKKSPVDKSFIFIMRWPVIVDVNSDSNFSVYHYDVTKNTDRLSKISLFATAPVSDGYSVPRLNTISADGKYVSFKLYGCWNCGGHQPQTLLYKLTEAKAKNIGKTSFFEWGNNGAYSYKEFKEIPCDPPSEGPATCSEPAEKLPLLTGSL